MAQLQNSQDLFKAAQAAVATSDLLVEVREQLKGGLPTSKAAVKRLTAALDQGAQACKVRSNVAHRHLISPWSFPQFVFISFFILESTVYNILQAHPGSSIRAPSLRPPPESSHLAHSNPPECRESCDAGRREAGRRRGRRGQRSSGDCDKAPGYHRGAAVQATEEPERRTGRACGERGADRRRRLQQVLRALRPVRPAKAEA